ERCDPPEPTARGGRYGPAREILPSGAGQPPTADEQLPGHGGEHPCPGVIQQTGAGQLLNQVGVGPQRRLSPPPWCCLPLPSFFGLLIFDGSVPGLCPVSVVSVLTHLGYLRHCGCSGEVSVAIGVTTATDTLCDRGNYLDRPQKDEGRGAGPRSEEHTS